MSLTTRDVISLLTKLKELDYRRFSYSDGEVRLEVSTDAGASPSLPDRPAAPAQAAPSSPAAPAATAAQPVQAARPAAAEPDSRPGLLAIKAPMNGTFYVAPSPGAPPFVVPGAQVKESDTIGIIEVMKLFNSIRAGVKGRVVEICVANEGQVKSGQTLAWIEPA